MQIPAPESRQAPDNRRTRRNVIAMAGIFASTVVSATMAASKIAKAGGTSWAPSSGSSGHQTTTTTTTTSGGGCFLCGTKIVTDNGEIAIEDLAVGDKVKTVLGELRVIKHTASWTVERKPNRVWWDDVAPIKICRSALAPNVPHRDLYLSPTHALYVDGVLISAKALVNGRSIVRCSEGEGDRLDYFHVELEDHQVIIAEGAPVESVLGDRMVPFAPIWFVGRRSELASRLRSALSPWVDRRKRADKVRDRIEESAYAA